MTTEANRLAFLLHEAGIGCRDSLHWHFADADALLARGVRVVDTDLPTGTDAPEPVTKAGTER